MAHRVSKLRASILLYKAKIGCRKVLVLLIELFNLKLLVPDRLNVNLLLRYVILLHTFVVKSFL